MVISCLAESNSISLILLLPLSKNLYLIKWYTWSVIEFLLENKWNVVLRHQQHLILARNQVFCCIAMTCNGATTNKCFPCKRELVFVRHRFQCQLLFLLSIVTHIPTHAIRQFNFWDGDENGYYSLYEPTCFLECAENLQRTKMLSAISTANIKLTRIITEGELRI